MWKLKLQVVLKSSGMGYTPRVGCNRLCNGLLFVAIKPTKTKAGGGESLRISNFKGILVGDNM